MSLFERLGGEEAVSAVVEQFYELMLKDQRVSHFYEAADMGKLKCRQKDFITLVTGGPNHYEGTDMKTAHCKMSISSKDFDVTWENLENSLKHFSVEEVLIEELKAIFYSVQEEIVKKTAAQAETSFKTKDVNQ
jgi:hemoglobin